MFLYSLMVQNVHDILVASSGNPVKSEWETTVDRMIHY